MDSPNTNTAWLRTVVSQSPDTAGDAVWGCFDHPYSSANPTVSVHVQDKMARTKQIAVDPEYQSDASAKAPANIVHYDHPGVPSTPGDDILDDREDTGGEETV